MDILKKAAPHATQADAQQAVGTSLQFIVFKVGGQAYAISIEQIREVVPTPQIAHLPQSPDFVQGVGNIRGNIIAIIDPHLCLGLQNTNPNNKANYTLVIESEAYKMGILVHEVPNTLNVNSTQVEEAGALSMGNGSSKFIKGLIKEASQLIVVIDAIELITSQQWHQN